MKSLDESEYIEIIIKNSAHIQSKQVELVNEIFVDEEAQIKRAHVIVKLFEMHEEQGITGFVDDEYGFIDEPIYKGALALLNR